MQTGHSAKSHVPVDRAVAFSATGESSYRRLATTQLRSVAGFERCDMLVLDDLVRRATLERCSRDTLLCRQGDETDGMTLVINGVVVIGTSLGQHDAHIVGFVGSGQLHTIAPVLDGQAQELDVMAHEACILLRFPGALIRQGVQRDPRIYDALTQLLARRMRVLYEKLRAAATLSIAQQLSGELDALARAFGIPRQQGLVIPLRLSQETLAQLLGASRQQINSALQRLQAMGVLRIGRQQVTIIDAAALQAQVRGTRLQLAACPRLQRDDATAY